MEIPVETPDVSNRSGGDQGSPGLERYWHL